MGLQVTNLLTGAVPWRLAIGGPLNPLTEELESGVLRSSNLRGCEQKLTQAISLLRCSPRLGAPHPVAASLWRGAPEPVPDLSSPPQPRPT
jgi:hypothetical protein